MAILLDGDTGQAMSEPTREEIGELLGPKLDRVNELAREIRDDMSRFAWAVAISHWAGEAEKVLIRLGDARAENEPRDLSIEERAALAEPTDRSGFPRCPGCWTNGHDHAKHCKYYGTGMEHHIRPKPIKTSSTLGYSRCPTCQSPQLCDYQQACLSGKVESDLDVMLKEPEFTKLIGRMETAGWDVSRARADDCARSARTMAEMRKQLDLMYGRIFSKRDYSAMHARLTSAERSKDSMTAKWTGVVRLLRCHVTNKPCGTDRWPDGVECACASCQEWLDWRGR